jgi:hypothetical protein
MNIVSELVEFWEKLGKLNNRLAGSKYVALVIWGCGTCSMILVKAGGAGIFELAKKAVEILFLVIPLTIIVYRLGSFWDDWLFDPIFKPEMDKLFQSLGDGMRIARSQAAWFLETGSREQEKDDKPTIKDIYKKAATLYEGTKKWEERITRPLELSKVCRSFIMPLVLVFLYDLFFKQRLQLSVQPNSVFHAYAFLGTEWAKWSSIVVAAILTLLYLRLRLHHLHEMYNLVYSEDSDFKIAVGFGPLSLDKAYELFASGCLLFVTRSEIRLIARKDSRLPIALDFLSKTHLKWYSRQPANSKSTAEIVR